MSDTHVYPLDDLIPHNTESRDCSCSPRIEESKKGTVVVHNSFDGRELQEQGLLIDPESQGMTRAELRQIASITANSCFVRFWFELSRDDRDRNLMGIAFMEFGGTPAKVYERDLEVRGFVRREDLLPIPCWVVLERILEVYES